MTGLDDLLVKTSRTFALSIPLLPEPTRGEVTTAYLLFRIADTFEDGALWPCTRRLRALEAFSREMLERRRPADLESLLRSWVSEPPVAHAGYVELLERSPAVLDAFWRLEEPAREVVRRHLLGTIRRMAGFVERARGTGRLDLRTVADLRDYCYAVAGIVGEMLTDLFLLGRPCLRPVADDLHRRARSFGEGLQLVNILKDSTTDVREGRSYLPEGIPREAVFDMAREDLSRAAEYVTILQAAGAERGVVAFNALPVLLARATLARVESRGAGSKLTRGEVSSIVEGLERSLDRGERAVPVPPVRGGLPGPGGGGKKVRGLARRSR